MSFDDRPGGGALMGLSIFLSSSITGNIKMMKMKDRNLGLNLRKL
jgi:hypothetical protein